jgi:hypothetical protein
VSSVSVFNELLKSVQLINHLNILKKILRYYQVSISKKSIERETQPLLSNFKARLDDAAVHLASK